MQTESIKKFSLFWLGALVLGLVNFALSYGAAQRVVEAQLAGSDAADWAAPALLAGIAISTVLALLLWWLVTRKRVEFIKWILLLWVVYNAVTIPGAAFAQFGVSAVLGLLTLLLQVAAIWFLFRPDAKAWFAASS